jgi:hypothetical protein
VLFSVEKSPLCSILNTIYRIFQEECARLKYMRTAGYIWTDYKTNAQIAKELKNNTNFRQITGIQEKLDTKCK